MIRSHVRKCLGRAGIVPGYGMISANRDGSYIGSLKNWQGHKERRNCERCQTDVNNFAQKADAPTSPTDTSQVVGETYPAARKRIFDGNRVN
jgi:hypothetical protein